ncbi:unnamed protein product [Ascophyllum nodosum]
MLAHRFLGSMTTRQVPGAVFRSVRADVALCGRLASIPLFASQPAQQQQLRRSRYQPLVHVRNMSRIAEIVRVPHHSSPFWNKRHNIALLGRPLFWMSISEAAGHLSFIFLGLGFLETDVLPLRMYAAAGISCSIAFQYFCPQPLWIPIAWNAIFLGINAGMVALLLKERHDASQQDKESATLYDQAFRESGLTAVDFMKIKGISKMTKCASGEVLARQDVKQRKLYLVVDGELQVSKDGHSIVTVGPGEFAGEMSFVRHYSREGEDSSGGCEGVAVADVTVKPGGAKVMCWDFQELQEMLSDNPNMSVCFNAALASGMVAKVIESHDPATKYRQLLQGVLVDGVVTLTERKELARMRRLVGVDDETHTREVEAAGWSAKEFDQGYLNESSSREYEALVRDVLRDGAVDDAGRTKLRDYRMDKGVGSLHHLRVLDKVGWTLDDLEEGKRLGRPAAASAALGGARGNTERSPSTDRLRKEAVYEEACAVIDEGGKKEGPRLTSADPVRPR